ncbi:MAG: ribbon-helix-helix domain protein [Bryobacterales bacterium]|nr:ribbon-helix-helix domain protein [Bryobacterales bacterium]
MAQKKAFPLRLDPATYDALQRWADADLRSLNGQIEYILRQALREARRLPPDPHAVAEQEQDEV